jgi:hypothetical protein
VPWDVVLNPCHSQEELQVTGIFWDDIFDGSLCPSATAAKVAQIVLAGDVDL